MPPPRRAAESSPTVAAAAAAAVPGAPATNSSGMLRSAAEDRRCGRVARRPAASAAQPCGVCTGRRGPGRAGGSSAGHTGLQLPAMSRPEGARGRGLSRGCRGVGQRRRRPGSAPRRRGRTTVEGAVTGAGRASATGVRTGQRGTGFAPPARRACRPPPVRRSPDKGRQPRGLPAWRASPSGPSCPARARPAALLPSWCGTFVPPPRRRYHVPLRVPARLAPGPLSVRRPTVLGTRARSDSARRCRLADTWCPGEPPMIFLSEPIIFE